jgi:hypothetical protein
MKKLSIILLAAIAAPAAAQTFDSKATSPKATWKQVEVQLEASEADNDIVFDGLSYGTAPSLVLHPVAQ